MEVAIAAFAACIGSFLNVCIWRLPREESIVFPASHCTRCRRAIAWHDNIPVLSFIWLGGKCRRCDARISWRYPLVEALAAVLAVTLYRDFGLTWDWAIMTCLGFALIVSTFVDLSHRIIPDEITKPGIVIGLAASVLIPSLHGTASRWHALGASALGAVVGGGVLYVTGLLGDVVFHKESMGGGDVKLLAMAGTVLGWQGALLTFFLAPMLAVVPGVVVLARKGDHTIPYGPFLSLAMVIVIFWGGWIIAALRLDESVHLLAALVRGLFGG